MFEQKTGSVLPYSIKTLIRQLGAVRNHRVSPERLKDINTPVLLITGDEDRLISWRCSVKMAESLSNSRVEVIKGAGHALIEQCHEKVNRDGITR
jgi:pimeloyl-ACP methyl ester carboxylesterase